MKDPGPICWYVAECSEIDNFPYMIRRGDGSAVAKVMTAEDARYLVNAAWMMADADDAERERRGYARGPDGVLRTL